MLAALLAPALFAIDPIKLHPDNPHYFLYGGKTSVLIISGEHYGSVLNLKFNYEAYLDELRRNGFNLTRTFAGTYREDGTSPHGPSPLSPGRGPQEFIAPWAWSGEEGGFEGNKFDLDRWNPAYFDRLRKYCKAAETRGVIVELVLFSRMYSDRSWRMSPLHSENNGQGGAWRQLPAERFLTLDSPELAKRQKAVVRKIVKELRDVPNVYFEIANEPLQPGPQAEPTGATFAWHREMLEEIVNAEKALPAGRRHLIAYNSHYDGNQGLGPPLDGAGLFNFHYLPRMKPALEMYDSGRALGFDETRFVAHPLYPTYRNAMTPAAGRLEAWEFLVGGGSVYSNLNHAYQVNDPAGKRAESEEFKGYLRSLAAFLKGFDLPRMRRDTKLVASGVESPPSHLSAIAEPGRQYALYLHHGSADPRMGSYRPAEQLRRATLVLNLPPGEYNAEWLRPSDLKRLGAATMRHKGGAVKLPESPEYTADIALKILRTGR